MARKVAIVARAPSSRYLAPFTDDSWEIWTLSPQGPPHWADIPRWDRYYEIHNLVEKEVECPGYIEWLARFGDKVWLREPHPDLPQAQIYPIQEILDYFDIHFEHPLRYYNNSVSLMMAHFIWEMRHSSDEAELGLWGVDMCQHEEYASQAPSCELFVGFAAGAGILMHIPEVCDLLKTCRIYGIENMTAFEAKMRVHCDELDRKLTRHHADLNDAKHQHVGAAAAHGELSAMLESLNGDEALEPLKVQINERLAALQAIGEQNKQICDRVDSEVKLCTGALEENRYIRQWQQ